MFKRIMKWLTTSRHVHLRQNAVSTKRELVSLLDRFLDDELSYQLEWDDFISWEHPDLFIEEVRDRIAGLEPRYMSGRREEVSRAIEITMNERNRVAAICGIEQRPLDPRVGA